MDVGLVGLGRMGGNMATRLVRGGPRVVGFDPAAAARQAAQTSGIDVVTSLRELAKALPPPRVVWIMVPAGEPTEAALRELAELLASGDTIIEGGNSHYKDDVRRAPVLGARGIQYVDAGVSGGIWGLTEGYCLMIGGDRDVVTRVAPIFTTLAPPDGWLHVGPVGSGHYVKMIHNGIEYGLMQAYAEGFELLSGSDYRLGPRPAGGREPLDPGERRSFVAARARRRRAEPRSQARRDQGMGRGLGRGPMDDRRCHREGGAHARDHCVALRALPLTPGELVRGPPAGRPPQRLRGPGRPPMG